MATELDVALYGASRVPTGEQVPVVPAETPAGSQYQAPTPVPAEARLATTLPAVEGAAEAAATEYAPTATMLESFSASAQVTMVGRAKQHFDKPRFAPDLGWDAVGFVNAVPFALQEGEREKLLETRSAAEGKWWMQRLEEERLLNRAMGDNPITSFLPQVLDPGALALGGPASLAAKALRIGRVGSAAGAVAGSVGFDVAVAGQVAPVSTEEVLLNAVFNGAGAAMAFRKGRVVPADEKFPQAEIQQAVQRLPQDVYGVQVYHAPPEAGLPVRVVEGEFLGQQRALPGERLRLESPLRPDLETTWHRVVDAPALEAPIRVQVPTERVQEVQTVRDIGNHSQGVADGRIVIAEDAKAVYLPDEDQVYLVRENIGPDDDVKGIVLHELGVHANGRQVLGDQVFDKLLKDLSGRTDAAAERARKAVPEDTPAELRAEEALGYFVEQNAGKADSIISRALDAGRRFLRKMGLNLKYSDTEVLGLVRQAAQSTTRAPGKGDVRYSRKPADLVQATVDAIKDPELAKRLGKRASWSWHKSMSRLFAPAADKLLQDPLDLTKNSATAEKDTVRRGWSLLQRDFEDKFLDVLKDRGFGYTERIFQWGKGREGYLKLERDVVEELARRQDAERVGTTFKGADEAVNALVDLHVKATKQVLAEAKLGGVKGAEGVQDSAGYFSRRWDFTKIESIEQKLVAAGSTAADAKASIIGLLERSILKANPDWEQSLRHSVARALYERARAKSYFEDAGYVGHMGLESVMEVRKMLDNLGIPQGDKDRVLEFMVGQVDEAGKPTSFKHRIALSTDEKLLLADGSSVTYLDMIDTGALTLLDRYMDSMSGRVGLAKVGLAQASDIDALKLEGMQKITSQADREEFNNMFDDAVKTLLGFPVGENVNKFIRGASAFTQLVGLRWSGLYQFAEVANISAKYGMLKTWKYMLAQVPGASSLFGDMRKDQSLATSFMNLMTEYASSDVRIRPLLQRFEDNYEMQHSDVVLNTLRQGRQLVPYMNGMKWVHHWTARTTANLITDTVLRAAKGDKAAADVLGKYGLTLPSTVKQDILKHGMDTAKWADGSWEAVRGPATRMMDEAVLRSRTGELPYFVSTSALGKFLTTFRSYVLSAHNKLLAGNLHQNGFAGVGILVLHQFPLAMATAHAQAMLQGKDLDDNALVAKAIAQMGSWGLFSEIWGIASGQKNEIGAPGMIGPDRIVGLLSAVAQGNLDAEKVANAMPLLAASPVIQSLQNLED